MERWRRDESKMAEGRSYLRAASTSSLYFVRIKGGAPARSQSAGPEGNRPPGTGSSPQSVAPRRSLKINDFPPVRSLRVMERMFLLPLPRLPGGKRKVPKPFPRLPGAKRKFPKPFPRLSSAKRKFPKPLPSLPGDKRKFPKPFLSPQGCPGKKHGCISQNQGCSREKQACFPNNQGCPITHPGRF